MTIRHLARCFLVLGFSLSALCAYGSSELSVEDVFLAAIRPPVLTAFLMANPRVEDREEAKVPMPVPTDTGGSGAPMAAPGDTGGSGAPALAIPL